MAKPNGDRKRFRMLPQLGLIWLVGALSDRVWFGCDRSVPAWDGADYLTGALNYWRALQHAQWWANDWWTSLWLLSSKIPPLTYIVTAFFLNVFGTHSDRATLVNLLFSAVLLGSVYGLGRRLFSQQVGLWAAGLCLLFPGLYVVRLDFMLDYPLTAVVTLCFYCLTLWREEGRRQNVNTSVGAPHSGEESKEQSQESTDPNASPLLRHQTIFTTWRRSREQKREVIIGVSEWLWATAFGVCLGLSLLAKQTAVFFLLTPILWVSVGTVRQRQWGRAAQLVWAFVLAASICAPWYRTNWLLILTSGKRATLDSAIAEGDPALTTLDAWTFYAKDLPYIISWPLLLVPAVGVLLYFGRLAFRERASGFSVGVKHSAIHTSPLQWLAIFWVGAYFLCSLNINKDSRYVLPYLPVLSIFLAYGLTLWPRRWGKYVRWGTASVAILLMLLNLWPIGGSLGNHLTQWLSPRAIHRAYLGAEWPHRQAIAEIIQTAPFLRSTLGVLPSTPEINQHNLNYYGALANFQVYGRQVGTRKKQVAQDARSLSWFLTKTGEQGSVPKEAQSAIVAAIAQSPDFQVQKTWPLPDGSTLNLYRQRVPAVEVSRKQGGIEDNTQSPIPVKLDRVTVPSVAPPGVPVPVTYEWSGSWEQLHSGLVLLKWRSHFDSPKSPFPQQIPASKIAWLHDRSIGMGALHPGGQNLQSHVFQVVERTAMLPPAEATGIYTLEATYLNRQTGETYAIAVPPVTLKIDASGAPTPAPELDWVTQLRTLATALPKGPKALGPVFEEIGRINQYDPIQDYTVQAAKSLEYRLGQEPSNVEWAYALALAKALRRDANGAAAALERVSQLDSKNPYAYAYLAVVHLYNLHAKAAEESLKRAIAIAPNQPEIRALNAVAALLQGKFFQAWQDFQAFKKLI